MQKPINIEIICIISIIIEIQVVQINKHRINREHTPLKKDPCIANADLESQKPEEKELSFLKFLFLKF